MNGRSIDYLVRRACSEIAVYFYPVLTVTQCLTCPVEISRLVEVAMRLLCR